MDASLILATVVQRNSFYHGYGPNHLVTSLKIDFRQDIYGFLEGNALLFTITLLGLDIVPMSIHESQNKSLDGDLSTIRYVNDWAQMIFIVS